MLTRKAIILVVLAAVLFLIASNLQTGWIFLLVFFLTLEIVFAFIVSRLQLKETSVKRDAPKRAVANKPFVITYHVENAPSGFTIYEEAIEKRFTAVAKSTELCFKIKLKRCCYKLNELALETTLPGGLFKFVKKFSQPDTLVVWPESDAETVCFGSDFFAAAGLVTAPHKKRGIDYAGVREYRAGDAIKKIHWKKTAVYRELLVRDEVDTYQKRAGVLLNNLIIKDAEVFEDLLAVARTVVENLFQNNFHFDFLYVEEGVIKCLPPENFLINDTLACLNPEKKPPVKIDLSDKSYQTLFVVTPAESWQILRLGFPRNIVYFLVGTDHVLFPSDFRVIKIERKSGKRIWVF